MDIRRVDLTGAGEELDTVVVIDVIRAFATTAYALEAEVEEIILVADVEEAFKLRDRFPDSLLIGELHGDPIEGFDFGNSPSALLGKDLSGRVLIHRTSAGTQGVAKSSAANSIYVTGLCNARATALKVLEQNPSSLTFVETGIWEGGWGDEDIACADYILSIMYGDPVGADEIVKRVKASRSAMQFDGQNADVFPPDDLDLILDIDRFDFAMTVERLNGLQYLRKDEDSRHLAS